MPEPVLLQRRAELIQQRPSDPRPWLAAERAQDRLEYRQYLLMERVFRPSGGIVGGDELARLLYARSWQPISQVARWIVEREVISFDWRGNIMLPLFQFDLSAMTVRTQVTDVLHELTEVFGDWELAVWFAEPNTWLDDHAPAAMLPFDARAVLDAARADRFVARG